MTLAEAVAAAVTSWLALAIAIAYGMDALGWRLAPAAVAVMVSAIVVATWLRTVRRATRNPDELVPWALIVTLLMGWLLWLAWPSLLPLGRGPDLTHHLLLVEFIQHTGRIPHDLGLEGAMGEMAHYTPGLHLLAVLAGAWTGTDGFATIYFIVALSAALTVGFVFLIVLRLLPVQPTRIPIALTSVFMVLGVRAYLADAFIHDSFLTQVVSTLFAVAMWWAVTVWDEVPSRLINGVIALSALGVFLTWPVWIGPPLVAFVALVLLRPGATVMARARALVLPLVPLAIVAVLHTSGRARWILLVRASGAALEPSIAVVGWVLPWLGLAGLLLAFTDRRARSSLLMIGAIAVQAAVLYGMAKSIGSDTPYMALKMSYLAIYPVAVVAALAVYEVLRHLPGARILPALVCAVISVFAIRPLLATPRPVPVVSRDFYDAGQWVRANVGTVCVDYLVEDAETAYWLHLAVLGNPRTSARTAEVDRYNSRQTVARWITSEGLPYAIADLRLLPDEIRTRVETVAQFGRAAVIKRPGAATCEVK